MDFFAQLTGNKVRARVIRALVSNELTPMTKAEMSKRSGVAAPGVSREIRALLAMGILKKSKSAEHKKGSKPEECFVLDSTSAYARSLAGFVREISPAQYDDIEQALKKTGRLTMIVLSGMFLGDPSRPADLLVVGDPLNQGHLERVVKLFEPKFGHEIRYAAFSVPEFRYRLTIQDRLLRDILDFPHHTLFDKSGIL